MSVYTDFQKFVSDMETSSTYHTWCQHNGGDCTRWTTYRSALLSTTPAPSRPSMSTSFGKALVDVGVMAVHAGLVPPPPAPPLTAAFTWVTSGLAATFTDTSTPGPSGPITAWHWDFGDGNTSSLRNPAHTYAGAASYLVVLTVTSADGTAPISHSVSVSVSGGVIPPTAPSTYTIPGGGTVVTTAAQLITQLAAGTPIIVLADGTYDNTSAFQNPHGCHLYAQNLLGATLTAGIECGGNSGPGGAIVQGIAFNISVLSKAKDADNTTGACINNWGPSGVNMQVLDCTFQGNYVVPWGVNAYSPAGLIAQRLVFNHFTDVALRASNNVHVAYHGSTPIIDSISDISVDGVTTSPPGLSNGTGEAGVWVGHPVTNGVHRIKCRNVSISGIETVNTSWDTTFSDLDIDMSGPNQNAAVGVYMEHFTTHDIFTNFLLVGCHTGFTAEWDDGVPGNQAVNNCTIQNGTIDAAGDAIAGNQAGVNLDQGTGPVTITGVTFKNQNWAAIGEYHVNGPITISGNTYLLPPGAVPISYGHQ